MTEANTRKFDQKKLIAHGVKGPLVKELEEKGTIVIEGKEITLDDVSWIREGDSVAVVIDTLPCRSAVEIARNANILLCESTYLDEEKELALLHNHMTAKQAARIAHEANVKQLILTHFSARYLSVKEFETEARMIFPNAYAADDLITFPFPKISIPPKE